MVSKIDLIPDEEFKQLVQDSSCTADILKALGYTVKGNSWAYGIVADRMEKLNITFGKKFTVNNDTIRTDLSTILKEDSNYNRSSLRERLISEGIKEYKCECCGLSEWNGKPIPLQLHHINGINNDNRLENLALLCPNCHAQTENFGTKGKGRVIKRKCDLLPLEDKKKILETVREFGIVEARKRLTYRNSVINAVVRLNHDKIVLIRKDGSEVEFNTTYEASRYMYNTYSIGSNPESTRMSISRCINGKQTDIQGFKFERRSAEL